MKPDAIKALIWASLIAFILTLSLSSCTSQRHGHDFAWRDLEHSKSLDLKKGKRSKKLQARATYHHKDRK